MHNQKAELAIKEAGLYKWQVARKIGISESSFSKWFRDPLTPKQVNEIMTAIQEIKNTTIVNSIIMDSSDQPF